MVFHVIQRNIKPQRYSYIRNLKEQFLIHSYSELLLKFNFLFVIASGEVLESGFHNISCLVFLLSFIDFINVDENERYPLLPT